MVPSIIICPCLLDSGKLFLRNLSHGCLSNTENVSLMNRKCFTIQRVVLIAGEKVRYHELKWHTIHMKQKGKLDLNQVVYQSPPTSINCLRVLRYPLYQHSHLGHLQLLVGDLLNSNLGQKEAPSMHSGGTLCTHHIILPVFRIHLQGRRKWRVIQCLSGCH